MRRSALGYLFYVNPFSSCVADVFQHFAYMISATVHWIVLTFEMVTSVAPCMRFLPMLFYIVKCEGHSTLHQL